MRYRVLLRELPNLQFNIQNNILLSTFIEIWVILQFLSVTCSQIISSIFINFLPADCQPFVWQQWLDQIHLRQAHIPYGNDQDYLQITKIRNYKPRLSRGVNFTCRESTGTSVSLVGESNLSVVCAGSRDLVSFCSMWRNEAGPRNRN